MSDQSTFKLMRVFNPLSYHTRLSLMKPDVWGKDFLTYLYNHKDSDVHSEELNKKLLNDIYSRKDIQEMTDASLQMLLTSTISQFFTDKREQFSKIRVIPFASTWNTLTSD